MIFTKGNLLVSKVASKNASDVERNCIRLNEDGSTVAIGKMIMAVGPLNQERVRFPNVGEHMNPKTGGVSIPLDLVDKALKNLPREKGSLAFQCIAMTKPRDPRKVELTCTDMRQVHRTEQLPKNTPFPDWKKILQKQRGQGSRRVCINRKDLIELLQALESSCPDKGGENPVFIEINEEGGGMVLRCFNNETGQRAVGGITSYKLPDGTWLPADKWEKEVFNISDKVPKKIGGVKHAGENQ